MMQCSKSLEASDDNEISLIPQQANDSTVPLAPHPLRGKTGAGLPCSFCKAAKREQSFHRFGLSRDDVPALGFRTIECLIRLANERGGIVADQGLTGRRRPR